MQSETCRRAGTRSYLIDNLFTAACLATAQQHFERAAVIFGLAERLRVEIGHRLDAPMRPLVETALEQGRQSLDSKRFMVAWAQGQNLSLDAGLALILN
jgi:hypothetical protein